MSKEQPDWQTMFREAITQSEMSLLEIATRAHVDHSQLSRFMRNQRGLTIQTAERISKVVGLELRKARKAKQQ